MGAKLALFFLLAFSDQNEPKETRFWIRVVDAQGRPAESVQVAGRESFSWKDSRIAKTNAKGRALWTITSKEETSWSFVAYDEKLGLGGVAIRDIRSANAAGSDEDFLRIQLSPVERSTPIEIRSANGEAINNARWYRTQITPLIGDAFTLFADVWEALAPKPTNGSALYSFTPPPMPNGGQANVLILSDNHIPTEWTWRKSAEPYQIRLDSGTPLEILVIDQDSGLPIPNAKVTGFYAAGWPKDYPRTPIPLGLDARLRMRVAPGDVRVSVDIPGRYCIYGHLAMAKVESGKPVTLIFPTRRAATVRGRVLDGQTKQPVRNASITIESLFESRHQSKSRNWLTVGFFSTDSNGRFEAEIPQLEFRLTVGSEGKFDRELLRRFGPPKTTIAIPDVELFSFPTLHGSVVDKDDKPIANVLVGERMQCGYWVQTVLTDAGGRFKLTPSLVESDLRPGKETPLPIVELIALDSRQRRQGRIEVDLSQLDKVLVLRLSPHAAGEPIPPVAPNAFGPEVKTSLTGKKAIELRGQDWLVARDSNAKMDFVRGRWTLLYFWTTWCGPCKRAQPNLLRCFEVFKDHGLDIVAVHDNSSPPDVIREYFKRTDFPFPTLIDTVDNQTTRAYEAEKTGYPTLVLIDPNGMIRETGRQLRIATAERLREYLLP